VAGRIYPYLEGEYHQQFSFIRGEYVILVVIQNYHFNAEAF